MDEQAMIEALMKNLQKCFYCVGHQKPSGKKYIHLYFALRGSVRESRLCQVEDEKLDLQPSETMIMTNPYTEVPNWFENWYEPTMKRLILCSKVNPFVRKLYTCTIRKMENANLDKRTVLCGNKKVKIGPGLDLLEEFYRVQIE